MFPIVVLSGWVWLGVLGRARVDGGVDLPMRTRSTSPPWFSHKRLRSRLSDVLVWRDLSLGSAS